MLNLLGFGIAVTAFTSPAIRMSGDALICINLPETSAGHVDRHPVGGAPRGGITAGALTFTRIAETGDAVPGRPASTFRIFTDPCINESGQVAFDATFTTSTGGADEGVFRLDGGGLIRLTDNGFDRPRPPGEVSGNFQSFSTTVINDAGAVLFHGGTEFADSEHGAYVFSGVDVGGLIVNDSATQSVPGQPGEAFLVFPFLNAERMLLSNSGHSAVIAQWRDISGTPHAGLYHGDVASGIVRIADDTVAPPGQPGTLFGGPLGGNPPTPTNPFDPFMCMNRIGDVAFAGTFSFGAGSGVYRFVSDTQTLMRVADTSMQPPNQPLGAVFSDIFNFPGMNDAGAVVFKALYSQGNGNEGLYVASPSGVLETIVDQSGAFPVPGQPGASFAAFEPPIINGNGEIVFGAALTGGTASGGLYRKSNGQILKIVDFSDPVPNQAGSTFNALDHFVLNSSGQVIFRGRFTGNRFGIYLHDGSSLSRIIDTTQTSELLGTPYSRLSVLFGFGGAGGEDGKPRPMNDSGEVAIRAYIADGQAPQCILKIALPEPCGVDAFGMETVAVGDPGNAPDGNDGAVDRVFRIGRFEVTNAQYVTFLNAVAVSDRHGLYDAVMTTSLRGGIVRSGSSGSFSYSLKPNFANKPANGVDWLDAARFCNWMHNGMIDGPQDERTSEDGAYDMSLPIDQIVRNPGARWFLPSNDEWYKAAYYDPFVVDAVAGGPPKYWMYPTRSDDLPNQAMGDLAVGDIVNPGPNVANYERGVDWNGTDCLDPQAVCGNVSSVGSAGSPGPWGAFDMGGNIYEWIEESGNPIAGTPPLPTRMARGGDFANGGVLMRKNLVIDVNMQANAANFGFRVAARFNPCPGDANCDDAVNIDDVAAFVLALIDPVAYRELHSDCDSVTADLNDDGFVDGLDVQQFMILLGIGG